MAPTHAFPIVDTHSHVISADTARFPIDPMGGRQSDWSRERPVDAAGMLAALADAGVSQTLLVQASTCYGLDNRYIEQCVRDEPERFAGVFSADLTSPGAVERLAHWFDAGLAGARVFVAGHTAAAHDVRLDDPRAEPAWAYLAQRGAPVSVQLRADKLPQLVHVLERHPHAVVLLDHCARPALDDGMPYAAAAPMFELARYPNLYVKYTTHNVRESAQGQATPASFLRKLVDCFGARRVAWGSNFPASSGSLREQLTQALEAAASLTLEEQFWVFGGTARALYPALRNTGSAQ